MYNWSTDEKVLKINEEKHRIWKLEQIINFGLGGEKINAKELKKLWLKISIDPFRRKFLNILLNGKRNSN